MSSKASYTHLLSLVTEARELRDEAQVQFTRVVLKARYEGKHTLEEIAQAAGLTAMRISQICKANPQEETDDD